MKVPFFDATRGANDDAPELLAAFDRVLRSGRYILGEEVTAFEAAATKYLGARHAVGISSGTDALLVALAALGVGRDAEVIVPAYGFVATAEVVARLGARPVFADVRADDLNIDVDRVAEKINARTRAIVAVHLFGAPANVEALARLGPPVIEDAAQAFAPGVGTIGAVGCFSFFPTKNLSGLGDGGLIVSGDETLTRRARSMRSHGQSTRDLFVEIGGNFRLDALQAALLSARLPKLAARLERRAEIARCYRAGLAEIASEDVVPLAPSPGATFNQFVVRTSDRIGRDRLRGRLEERGVATQIYYARALPDQPCFAPFEPRGDFAIARAAARTTLALPCYPELRDDEIDLVLLAIDACMK